MYFCAWSSFTLSILQNNWTKLNCGCIYPVELKINTKKKTNILRQSKKKVNKTKIWAIKSEQFIDYGKKTNLINCLIHAVSVSDWMINEKKTAHKCIRRWSNPSSQYRTVYISVSFCVALNSSEFEDRITTSCRFHLYSMKMKVGK